MIKRKDFTEEMEHIREIVGDIYNMDYKHVDHSELIEEAEEYSDEFGYNLTSEQISAIVLDIVKDHFPVN